MVGKSVASDKNENPAQQSHVFCNNETAYAVK
jgi:hypothetical protein